MSAIPLAAMTLPYSRYEFARALSGIAQAGYRYVAFGLPHAGKPVPADDGPDEAQALAAALERHGLQAVMLVGTAAFEPGQPLERARQRLELARALGAREVLSLGVWGYRKFPDEPLAADELAARSAAFVAHFRQIARLAEEIGVVVTLKPHTGNTATGAVLAETLAAIGSPLVKASYDPGNVRFYEGIEPDEDVGHIAAQTHSLVAKDHRGPRAHADFPIPGEGAVNFPRILAQLRAHGFCGPVVVERIDGQDRDPLPPEEIDRRLARARRNLVQVLEGAGFAVA